MKRISFILLAFFLFIPFSQGQISDKGTYITFATATDTITIAKDKILPVFKSDPNGVSVYLTGVDRPIKFKAVDHGYANGYKMRIDLERIFFNSFKKDVYRTVFNYDDDDTLRTIKLYYWNTDTTSILLKTDTITYDGGNYKSQYSY